MTNEPNEYEPGIDQNQGVVGTMARNQQHGDTETEGTQAADLDPNLVTNQPTDSLAETDADTIGEQEYIDDQGVD